MALIVKVYVVGEVLDPPRSVVVIAPVFVFNKQFACEAFVRTFVVSVKVIGVSPVAARVAIVPLKFPANVPNDPAFVVQDGASETVNKAELDLTALPSLFSTLIK